MKEQKRSNEIIIKDIEYSVIAKKFTGKQLKDICKKYNVTQKGNKLDLVKRLCNAGYYKDLVNKKNLTLSKN